VLITDGGEPAYVLLRHDAYRRLISKEPSNLELLAQPGDLDFEFDPPRMGKNISHMPDLASCSSWTRTSSLNPHEWQVLACALLLHCPKWTEDRHFFGAGFATWTTALVESYFTETARGPAEH
jgi:hypothetical protein